MPNIRTRVEVREVEDLFNADAIFEQAAVNLTPDTVEYYRSVAPFAFALDRQSLGIAALGDPTKTGHEGRVSTIQRLTRNFHLPAPVERPGRVRGQLRYIFDERFWFIDGEENRSTGWSARPEVRPRLWMAYALARKLKGLDPEAAPAAFVFGDPTRFFRADNWLRTWAQAILNEGIMLLVEGFDGPVTMDTLEWVALQVRFQSMHLPKHRERAVEELKRREELFYTRLPTGLTLKNRTEIWTDPPAFNVIREVIEGLAEGRWRAATEAAAYLKDTYGDEFPHTSYWILSLFSERFAWIETGDFHAYTQKAVPCRIKQKHGPHWELDFTSSGNRRYVFKDTPKEDWLTKRVQYSEGTEPIRPEVYRLAKRRIKTGGGRTDMAGVAVHRQYCILRMAQLRCSTITGAGTPCGRAIEERSPGRYGGKNHNWSLTCQCVHYYRNSHSMRHEDAVALPECQHARYLRASASLALIDVLKETLLSEAFDLSRYSTADEDAWSRDEKRRADLRAEISQAQEQLSRLVDAVSLGVIDVQSSEGRAAFQEKQSALQTRIDAAKKLLENAADTARPQTQPETEMREAWNAGIAGRADDLAFWREVSEALVDRVEVNLNTSDMVVHINVGAPDLRTLDTTAMPIARGGGRETVARFGSVESWEDFVRKPVRESRFS